MKTKLHSCFILLALVAGVHQAAAAVLLSDDFNSNVLDTSKWSINTSYFGNTVGTPSVVVANQRCEITSRGHLNTVADFDPAAPGGLQITGTWTFVNTTADGEDFPWIVNRSSGVAVQTFGEISDGVVYRLSVTTAPSPSLFDIVGTGGATVTGLNVVSNTLNLAQGDSVNFTITDDGTNLSFSVAKIGDPTQAASATAMCLNHLAANKISFYNHQYNDTAAVDNIVVQTIPTMPSVPFTYTTNNGAITITGYTGTNAAVTIPSTINGLPVASIGNNAFDSRSNSFTANITSVIIPAGVTNLGAYAFNYCTSLTNVTVPNSVINIGADAFFNCSSLASVILPTNITTIADATFGQCYSLTGITIPSGVTSIGYYGFAECHDLHSITIPNSVTNIGGLAFAYCNVLLRVTIGTGVSSIGNFAFASDNLTNISFLGNSPTPTNDTSVFQYDTSAIAYILPGTTGWGATFDGIPTSLIVTSPPVTSTYLYTGSETNITLPPGTYNITAYGAQGGGLNCYGAPIPIGGLGAEMSGEFNFSSSTTLTLLVGGTGGGDTTSGGGGGGSFVVNGSTPLVIAAGGGGGGYVGGVGGNGSSGSSGSSGGWPQAGSGGSLGNGGNGGGYGGGGGGGGYGGGGSNGYGGGGGGSFSNGGGGGYAGFGGVSVGGFGGGGGGSYGGSNANGGGGGGGGYSGGGGGGDYGGGGGGGSIIDSSAITNLAEVSGIASPDGSPNGEIIITTISVVSAPSPPALGMSTYGSQPAVFFPTATGTNFVLQMTTNLTQPVIWVTVTNGVPISGIIITNALPAAFYRLH